MASLPTPGGSDVWGADLNAAIESLHLSGAHAARPSTDLAEGTLYSCSDHDLVYRWDGSTWATWATVGRGTSRPLVDPTGLTWSWVNQGVASVSTQGASLLLSSPAEGADNWHFRAKTVPAKPYSAIVHLNPAFFNVNYSGVGVGWMQSSNGYFALFNQRGGGSVLESATSTANYRVTTVHTSSAFTTPWEWVKLTDDATNRRIYISRDGYNWLLFHSVATNDVLTPDRLVFGIQSRSSMPVGVTVDSWEEGA